jgi:UDP-glucose 4-epimerase
MVEPAPDASAPTRRASSKRGGATPATPTKKKKNASLATTKAPRKKAPTPTSAPTSPVTAPPSSMPTTTPAPSMRVVAVTGAFGFLGRKLLERLEADPAVDRVVAIDVRSGLSLLDDTDDHHAAVFLRHPKLSAHPLDLTTPGADRELASILRAEQAGTVFHLAMLSSPTHHSEMAHELETIGTHYVLNAVGDAGVQRLRSLSSAMCYGARPDNPAFLNEGHALRPPPARALRDKADADADARRFAAEHPEVSVCVARLGAMLPTSKDHFWTRLMSRRVVPAVLGYDPLLQFMHPDDAVAALLALWRADARGPVNVVGRGQLPLSHILTRLERLPLYLPAGLGQSLVAALWQAQLVEMPHRYVQFLRWPWLVDDARLRQLTGFVPKHDLSTVLNIVASHTESP